MGLGVGGSLAIWNGVMNLRSPFGGPVSAIVCCRVGGPMYYVPSGEGYVEYNDAVLLGRWI